MSEIDKEPFPMFALYAVGIVMALAITAAAIGAQQKDEQSAQSSAMQEPVASFVDLQFLDQIDGAVLVKNAATSQVVLKIMPNEDAFIRAVIRGLVRDRVAQKLSHDPPFRLYQLVDSRLVIEDTATKKRINLRAFGPTQQAAFQRLLPTPLAAPK